MKITLKDKEDHTKLVNEVDNIIINSKSKTLYAYRKKELIAIIDLDTWRILS